MTSIWWIRRDVRLEDQRTLQAAMERGPVVPLFILDPRSAKANAKTQAGFFV